MKKLLILFCLALSNSFLFAQTTTTSQPPATRPFVLGIVHDMPSKILGETRTLNIYLPEGYAANDSLSYPVIYLLDGSADEDFIHIAGLVQFNSFEWVKQVPKSIVVGIATVNRRRDFTFPTGIEKDKKAYPTAGHSARFISFLEKELQPFVNSHYRTNSGKTLIGQSLGGLLATEILFKKPALFNQYIIVSPSLWWDNGSLLAAPVPAINNTRVYIGVGKEGLTPTELPRVMEVDANILADKLKNAKSSGMAVFFDYLPAEDHATILHQAVFNAFRIFSGAAKEN